jgi:hypothetical protein
MEVWHSFAVGLTLRHAFECMRTFCVTKCALVLVCVCALPKKCVCVCVCVCVCRKLRSACVIRVQPSGVPGGSGACNRSSIMQLVRMVVLVSVCACMAGPESALL